MGKHNRLVVSLALAALFAGGVTACSSGDAQALIAEAKEYQKKGEPKAAIIQLKNVLQKTPDNAEARSLLGRIYLDSGDPQSAEKELRKALSLGADADQLLPTLGKVLLLQGQYQKVLDEVRQPDSAKPDPEYLILQGNAHFALGHSEKAREAFETALKERADSPDALVGLAKLALLDRDTAGASRMVEQATAASPSHVEAWLFKGDLLRAQDKSDEALAAYATAIELKPNSLSAYIARAHLQINSGNFDAAKAELDAARKQDPKSLMISYSQALLEFKQEKHTAALESIQQVLRAAPDHMPSVLLAGAIQFALGSTQQAEQHLKKFLERTPNNPYATRLLVATLLKNKDTTRALKTLEPLLKSGDKDRQLLTLAGETYMQAKEYSKATEYFEQASRLAPDAANIRTALGVSRMAQGENARGIAELEMAADLDPKSTQAGVLLVMTHMKLKEYDKALATVAKLEKNQSANPLLFNLKGGVLLAKKDVAGARENFQKALSLQPKYFPAVANLAQMDMQEKKVDAAKKRLEAYLETDKQNGQAMVALAGIALSQGNNGEATSWLERAISENPDDLKASSVLTVHYLTTGEKQKAFVLAQKLLTTFPNDPDVIDLSAQTQMAQGDFASALQSYKKAQAIAPKSPVIHYRMAAVQLALQNQKDAEESLKTALSVKPDYLDAQVALATLAIRKGAFDQALKIAKQIQGQLPKNVVGQVLEGDAYLAQKKADLALKAYEHAFSISRSGPVVVKLHQALERTGHEKEGEGRVIQWLKEYPQDVTTRMYLAAKYLVNKQMPAAIGQYQTILKSNPKNAVALNNLALAYHHEKDQRALEFAEQAYAAAPESPAILDTLGWLLIESGNVSRGLPLLQKAANAAPGELEIRFHLAQGLLKSGAQADARRELEALLAAGKEFPMAVEAKALLARLQSGV